MKAPKYTFKHSWWYKLGVPILAGLLGGIVINLLAGHILGAQSFGWFCFPGGIIFLGGFVLTTM